MRTERIVAEYRPEDDRFLVMLPDGQVEGADSISAVNRIVRRRALKVAPVVTTLEWRNLTEADARLIEKAGGLRQEPITGIILCKRGSETKITSSGRDRQ